MNLGLLATALVMGIAAIGSAIGIGIAGQASIGSWKKCYLNNKAAPFILTVFAGAPLTPYYSYMLQLKEQIPILTAYGSYYDAQGNLYTYDSDDGGAYESAVNDYFYLEYHNLQKDRRQSLFQPYP